MKEIENVLAYTNERIEALIVRYACLDDMKDIATGEDIIKKKEEWLEGRGVLIDCKELLVGFLTKEKL